MPELPEVEIVRRGMERVLTGKKVAGIEIRRADLRMPVTPGMDKILEGQTIQKLGRRGKYIITLFGNSSNATLLHLGMSGRIRIYAPGDSFSPQKHDHIIMHTADHTRVVFHDPRRFGMFHLIPAQWEQHPPFDLMGPEPLEDWTGKKLAASLKNRKTPIKQALLDQRIVAGLGNIYVCEALYRTGINPVRGAETLSASETGNLVKAVREILHEAIESGGSTLKDHRQTDGTLGYFQHHFAVYGREGKKCPSCTCGQNNIKRIVQSGRSTFFCPVRQN